MKGQLQKFVSATGSAEEPLAPGRSSITQRHAAKLDERTRAAQHAILEAAWAPVQLARDGHSGLDEAELHAAATYGLSSSGGPLPHLDAIQRSFGPHDVSGVTAHVGGPAREASQAMGANGYATGDHVAFAEQPDLFLAAHEAAHVVQQRAGVHLSSAVGQAGDSYEQHADAVAARVVAGESAADLLGAVATGGDAKLQLDRRPARYRDKDQPKNPADAVSLPGGEKAGGGDEKAEKEGASFFPVLDKVNATIAGVKKLAGVVQEITHSHSNIKRIPLPPMYKNFQESEPGLQLKLIHNHKMAQRICDQAFKFAMDSGGIDLRQLDSNGRLPAKPAIGPTPPPGPAPAKVRTKDVFTQEDVEQLARRMDALQTLAQNNMKDEVDLELKQMVHTAPALPEDTFFWTGDDQYGNRKMTEADQTLARLGAAHGCWGILTASLEMTHVPGGAKGGMPSDVKHFMLPPTEKMYSPMWVSGGGIDLVEKEDVEITVTSTEPKEDLHKPTGAYKLKSIWKWDESTSMFDCEIVPYGLSYTRFLNIDLHGTHADDGWI